MKRHFDSDPFSNSSEVFHAFAEDEFCVETVADVEPIIEANKRLYTDGTDGWSPTREIKRIASVPINVIQLWKERYGVDLFNRNHDAAVKRLLNDPEWRYRRTAPGCV